MKKTGDTQRSLQVALNIGRKAKGNCRQVAEVCWCVLALALFMVLGPFAAPVAVIALLGLPPEERGESEPEMIPESTVGYQLR